MKSHLVGIGGVGMSALAEFLSDRGEEVTGSDRFLDHHTAVASLACLRARGIRLYPQDGSGVQDDTDRVLVSTAIEADNPDLTMAKKRGIPVVHRARALAEGLSRQKLIAVAGTCGKSSTTAILGHLFEVAGASPTVVNGAPCINWISPMRTGAVLSGTGEYCIAEVDESDRSLLDFKPEAAILLNVSADHFPLAESNALFERFLSQVKGVVVDGRKLPPPENVRAGDWSVSFTLDGQELTLPIPGLHNAWNAAAACRLAKELGVSACCFPEALASFRGVSRRLELVGTSPLGYRAVDDYAHNTEKIRACLRTLQARAARVLAIWRPHGYQPLRAMWGDLKTMFGQTLRRTDRLLVLPIFDAGGTTRRDISSKDFVAELVREGCSAEYAETPECARDRARAWAEDGDILVTLGARDPGLPGLCRSLL